MGNISSMEKMSRSSLFKCHYGFPFNDRYLEFHEVKFNQFNVNISINKSKSEIIRIYFFNQNDLNFD